METRLFVGFSHIGVNEKVCGGEPIIVGTRLKPEQIVNYGTIEEAMKDFQLTEEQIKECYRFVSSV